MQSAAPRCFGIILGGQRLFVFHPGNIAYEATDDPAVLVKPALTRREVQVLTLLARGTAYRAIGHCLSIAEDTAKTHVQNARRKLNARNGTHAVVMAITNRLIKL